ncbi:MAG: glycoside hydrolase family 88 protein [Candidatus Sumerlaeota bacterium]|nr:glycoside hydrolase family 88 protein [Candidatus Sumerlaeota bacterium]
MAEKSESASASRSEQTLAPQEVARAADLMRKANEWQFTHPIMPSGCRNWIRGTWYTGVMAAYKATGDQRYLDQALAWGKQHQWQVGNERQGANRLFCVETWTELYFIKKDRAMIELAIQSLDTASSNSPSGAKVWYAENGLRYADSLYGAPALAMLAKATGDRKYLDWMNAFFWDVHAELFDPATGLFFRDKRFIHKPNVNGKKTLWSRGNGWVVGGIVRILEYLPSGDPMRARYEDLLKTMAASLAKRQGEDGLWRMNLDDPAEFPMPETSGTSFFVYAIAWGVNNGVLDRATYEPVARKGWAGLTSCISPEGQVLWGQKVGANPYAIEKSDTHEYVTGTFLLAGAEMLKLLGGKPAGNQP